MKISLKFVHKSPINNIPASVQIMAWRRSGDKPLSEPMMVSLLTHICVTRPQWVKGIRGWRRFKCRPHQTSGDLSVKLGHDHAWNHGHWYKAGRVTARFVTRFNLWLRHDLWPHNASICDPARFVTKSASICDQRYTMILESKLCRGKLVFVFTLIMYATWYNMMHIYMNYAIILI